MPDRTCAHSLIVLASFTGHLQADAYAGYDKLYHIAKIAAGWPAALWDELLRWNWQKPSDVPLASVEAFGPHLPPTDVDVLS
jgi:hypothetical protein